MPLGVLIIMVVVGIAGIAAMLHLTGRSATSVLGNDAVRAGWVRHYPDDNVTRFILSRDRQTALVFTNRGPGLIWAFGADTVARHLRDCDLTDTDDGIRIDFHDYSVPPVTIRLTSDERAQWRADLETAA